MPVITRKEFSELCGDRQDALMVYITRDKVVLHPADKKLLDTEDPINSAFIAARQAFNAAKGTKSEVKAPKEPKKKLNFVDIEHVERRGRPKKGQEKRVDPAEIQKKERQLAEQHVISKLRLDQDMQKKAQDMELVAIRIQSEKIRLDKTAGNLLPIELVTGVIERHANSILKTFEKGFDRIGELYATMAGFGPVQKAEFMKECKEELAQCVELSGKKSQDEIDILIDNYSESLMKGQRKA